MTIAVIGATGKLGRALMTMPNTIDVEIGMNCQLATKTTTMTTMNAR